MASIPEVKSNGEVPSLEQLCKNTIDTKLGDDLFINAISQRAIPLNLGVPILAEKFEKMGLDKQIEAKQCQEFFEKCINNNESIKKALYFKTVANFFKKIKGVETWKIRQLLENIPKDNYDDILFIIINRTNLKNFTCKDSKMFFSFID